MRPTAVLQRLWETGRAVIDSVYPHSLAVATHLPSPIDVAALPASSRIIEHVGNSGTFLAFGIQELVAAAQKADCMIELLPQVGDFVTRDDPLFRVYPADSNVDEAALRLMVAFGVERTMEQDPGFAFRIMVDIAARALSPAINDPTPPCWRWISSIASCATSASNSSTLAKSQMDKAHCGCSTRHRGGKIL